jgi:response regulator RpfG family c-di-GMP phosphodiesterase
LKVLFIGYTEDINGPIEKMMRRHFPNIDLIALNHPYSSVDLMIKITSDGPFSFVVMTIDNWDVVASEAYETILDTLGERPFLFIGSPASLKGQITNNILEKSQTNFLIKTPILSKDLVEAVNSSIDWTKQEEFDESIQEFKKEDLQKMRMRNFYLFDQLPYDVYLELTSNHFGKIISKNRPYSHQLIRNYAKKNVKYLFIKSDEYLKFLDLSIKSVIKDYEQKIVDKKIILALHLKTIFLIHQFLKTLSVSEEIIKLTKSFIDNTKSFIREQESINDLIGVITDSDNMTFAEQSLATAYICESMIYHMGWSSEMSRDKVLLASLLQDIALNNDELIKVKSLNDPILKIFSDEEQETFKNHPSKAAQISTFFYGFSDADFILSEHHERPFGDGFPKGLNSSGLTTISCLFILANNFVSRLAQTPKDEMSYFEIVTHMKRSFNSGNFKDPLKALEKTFKPSK